MTRHFHNTHAQPQTRMYRNTYVHTEKKTAATIRKGKKGLLKRVASVLHHYHLTAIPTPPRSLSPSNGLSRSLFEFTDHCIALSAHHPCLA